MEFLREPEAGLTSLLELATNEQIFQLLNENDKTIKSIIVFNISKWTYENSSKIHFLLLWF